MSVAKQPVFWGACVAVVAVALVLVANLAGRHSAPRGDHKIVYSISGTVSKPTIYYLDLHQDAQHVDSASLPWTKTLSSVISTGGYRVGAVLKGNSAHDRLTCTVRVDGKVTSTHTTTATDPQVRCSS